MEYENVEFSYPNFCIAPIDGQFCSIDHDNDVMRTKNSSGDLIKSYDLDTNVSEIKSIEYTGPRDVGIAIAQLGEELPFFTLDIDDANDTYFVREWRLSTTNSKLELENTISGSTDTIDCHDMAIEYYHTEFDGATVTGTGKIKLDDYSNLEVGNKLLLGPSSDMDNLYAFEWVEVTNIASGWVHITSDGLTPPHNEYADEDQITYYKNIFLFSDIGEDGDQTKGALYKIDPYDVNPINPTILDTKYNGLYSGVRASAWSLPYESIGMVKGSNLLYIDPNSNYEIQKSHALTNIQADDVTIITVHDLIFDSNTIYRLQDKITLVNDSGDKTTTTWTEYNYHQDTIAPYTKSISLAVDPDCIVLNDDPPNSEGEVTITAVVRDQYGVGLLSKLIYFTKAGGDPSGYFTPLNGQATTDANGVATITYTTGDYDLSGTNAEINIKARTDGASTSTGSQYVWDEVSLFLYSKFTTDLINLIQKPTLSSTWPTEGSDLYSQIYMTQISGMENEFNIKQLNKFQFPGGPWKGNQPPTDYSAAIRQLEDFEGEKYIGQLDRWPDIDTSIFQDKEQSNDLQLSQTFISRHLSSGHKDDVDIDQFKFIEDAIPAFWSEKNPVNTNIWIRLRPFAFNLNQNSLIFRVKEISYAGDTGYIDVTSSCVITTFDAGGGLLGLDILYNPPQNFHHNGIVYVDIEVYDQAPSPNIIVVDYWFKIIPDYKSPYITNENPAREEEDVSIDTNISFDLLDAGVGVDINTLEFYINNRRVDHTVSAISGGYHISYDPSKDFYYGQTVEITVRVEDASDNQNILYDMWRFYIAGSTGPWFDRGSFYPKPCAEGVYRKQTGISFNVYGINDTGVDRESILVTIGGKYRDVTITPIIYRVE